MDSRFEPLLSAMDAMLETHRELAGLGREKQGVIIAGNVDRLSAIVQREMRLMQQSAGQEKKRAAAAAALAAELGLSGEAAISQLAGQADGEASARLMAQGRELQALLMEQKDHNARAKGLLETHLEFNDMMLNLMVGPEDPLNNIYGASGAEESSRRQTPGLFDKQA